MPTPKKYLAPFEENKYYHVYNQTVGNRLLFTKWENYRYFLARFEEYLSAWVEVEAWCLMGNHFHFLVRVKAINELEEAAILALKSFDSLNKCIVNQFKKFFTAYSAAFNKQENTVGSLFEPKFKRIWINSETYYTRLIYYIHTNPRHHGVMYDFEYYEWSSYKRMLSPQETKLAKEKVLEWFNGVEGYITFHQQGDIEIKGLEDYLID